jgi:hypothetical protein
MRNRTFVKVVIWVTVLAMALAVVVSSISSLTS